MKRKAQPTLTVEGQQALDKSVSTLKQEDLTTKTTRNYLRNLRQFMACMNALGAMSLTTDSLLELPHPC